MAKRGPKNRPSALRLVEGSDVGSRYNPDEPVPPKLEDKPTPPTWLNARARRVWGRLAQDLWEMGVLSAVDQDQFAAHCALVARWEQCEIDFEKAAKRDSKSHGCVVYTDKGNAIQNPLMGLLNTLRRDMQTSAALFGLTPSSRVSIRSKSKGDVDPIESKYFA